MELRDEVAQRFAAWRQRPGSPDVAAATAPAPERRRTILVDAARPGSPPPATAAVFIVVRLAAIASGDDAAESALVGYLSVRIAAALGEGAEVLVTRGDLATGTPLLLVRGRFETSRVPEAIRRITEELARVAQAPLPDTATNLARWVAAIGAAYRFDTNAGAADAAALLFAAKLPLDAWDRLPASIAALDAARIWAAARGSSIGREAIGVSGDAAAIEPMLRAAGLDPERAPSP
jgi:hypothetical protein